MTPEKRATVRGPGPGTEGGLVPTLGLTLFFFGAWRQGKDEEEEGLVPTLGLTLFFLGAWRQGKDEEEEEGEGEGEGEKETPSIG